MCGICGKFNYDRSRPVSRALIQDMTALLTHRGPDDEGLHVSGAIGLGHRRLSIIDVAGGHQPISNADGTVWIVFNGEIYNHRMLRRDLEGRGYTYTTHTDTESILHAYEAYGVDCVTHLRGMFAFAIWDSRDESLFLARDHFGIKPLYHAETADGIVFASELKALFLDEGVDETLDERALYDYFTFKFIPGPATPYRAIRKLPPAHWMRVRRGRVELQRYWEPAYTGPSAASEGEHLEALEALLHGVVEEQRMSEVPLGVFLSGGVDSTLLALLHARMTDTPIATFAMGFEGRRGYDETTYARQAAEACGATHHEFQCTADSVKQLPDILWHVEEPLADAAMLPLYTLCHEAARHVTVVHCGDGADEAFGGYTRFFWDEIAQSFGRIPEVVRRGALAPMFRGLQVAPGPLRELGRRGEKFCRYAGLAPAERYLNWFTHFPDATKHGLLHPDLLARVGDYRSVAVFEESFRDAQRIGLDSLGQRQYCELQRFIPDDLMLKSDKLSMSAGLEGRFPFLDPRVVEFGLALPSRQKTGPRQLKRLLRQLLAKYMPRDFVYRKKQGFEVPVGAWFRDSLGTELKDLHREVERGAMPFLRAEGLGDLLARLERGDPAAARQCFPVYVFAEWYRLFASPRQRVRAQINGRRRGVLE